MSTRTIFAGIIGAHFGIAAAITAGAVTLEPSSAAPAAAAASSHRVDIPRWVVRPCAGDDDVNCRWIPPANLPAGLGGWEHVSIRRQVPGSAGMVCVFYANHRYARHHDYCS